LRDRAFIYWRMLIEDIDMAKTIILGSRPASNPIVDNFFEEDLLGQMINDIGYVNSIQYCAAESLPLLKIKQQVYQDKKEVTTNNNLIGTQENEKVNSPKKTESSKKEDTKKVTFSSGNPKNDEKDQNDIKG